MFLRQRAVALTQDLALGDGPMVPILAAMEDVPAANLGRALRARRREFLLIIGDASAPSWAERFLARLDSLASELRERE